MPRKGLFVLENGMRKMITRVDVYTGGVWVFSTICPRGAASILNGNTKFGLVIHHSN